MTREEFAERCARAGIERFTGQAGWRYPECPWRLKTLDGRFTYKDRFPANVFKLFP
jgi:hypothetical protein